MPLDATVGGSSANSYGTLLEATSYFNSRLNSEDFLDASPEDQEKALVMGCFRIDQVRYEGYRTSSTQAREFPRTGITTYDSRVIDSNVIPIEVKYAQFEMALVMLGTDYLKDSGLSNFRNLSLAGVISITPRSFSEAELPSVVIRYLEDFSLDFGGVVRLERS